MKRATTHFEQVPKVIAEKVLARQTSPLETDVDESDEMVEPKFSGAVPAVRSRKVEGKRSVNATGRTVSRGKKEWA